MIMTPSLFQQKETASRGLGNELKLLGGRLAGALRDCAASIEQGVEHKHSASQPPGLGR